MEFNCSYDQRDLDVQIRIDNLQRVHNYKYPLHWYESKTDKELKAMHTQQLVKYAENVEKRLGSLA